MDSAQSYLSHYSRVIRRRRIQRELRTHAQYPLRRSLRSLRRLPVQATNNPLVNYFFNGSPF
jgi:hypothetical protein